MDNLLKSDEIEKAHHNAVEHAKKEHQGVLLPDDLIQAGAQAYHDKLSATTDEGMVEIIAREIGQHTENIPWEDCSDSEIFAAKTCARWILLQLAPIHALQIRDAVENALKLERERIITMIENDYPEEAQSIRKALKEKEER